MTRIRDLLDRSFSRPIKDVINIEDDDPDTVFAELTEYVATDYIKAEYERLFSALAEGPHSSSGGIGVWISGFFGSGKSSFAKNLGYVLANQQVNGASASCLFRKQVESKRLAECIDHLNRKVPYDVFLLSVERRPPAQANCEHLTDAMYRSLLRDLDCAEGHSIAEIENVRSPAKLQIRDFVQKSFALCEIHRPGRSFAFIMDDIDKTLAPGERTEEFCAIVEEFGKESQARLKAGKIPGPVWIIATSENKLQDNRTGRPKLEKYFKHQIDLSAAGIGEVAARRVLPKKESEKPLLSKLFQDHGASLIQNVKLERCSCNTDFDEQQFLQFYPYLPHLIDLSLKIMAGLQLQPNTRRLFAEGSHTIVKQCFDMLLSDRIQLADQPMGELVSVDKIYELVENDIPWPKQKDVRDIRERFDDDITHPGLASRVAKVICLMELVKTGLPRTTQNIAALLVRHVVEAPPIDEVAEILDRLNTKRFVRQTEDGWKLYDFDELRLAATGLQVQNVVGRVNPRPPGWHNDFIQLGKKVFARLLTWYIRPSQQFNAAVRRSLEEIVVVLERRNMADQYAPELVDQLSLNVAALEARLDQSEKHSATLAASLQHQLDLLHEQVKTLAGFQPSNLEPPAVSVRTELESSGFAADRGKQNYKTTYIIGLFGTGRLYINELLVANIGERARYLKDTIRLHPGPTPMIYSGHATVKYVSRAQESPAVTSCIRQAVKSGFANLIFLYRHPLDSLLTNWVWWRTYMRHNRTISGISQIYKSTEDLCADLERHFPEFLEFAGGDPHFFSGLPGPRFLSFPEFVEETELHLEFTTLQLRLEDCMADPDMEFAKVLDLVAPDAGRNDLCVPPPRAKAYGHLAVQERLPGFRNFVDGLDTETKRRIARIGYREIA